MNNIAINVFTGGKNNFSNIYLSEHYDDDMMLPENIKEINLLYIVENEDEDQLVQEDKLKYFSNGHYIAITKFDSLVALTVKNSKKKHYKICKKMFTSILRRREI